MSLFSQTLKSIRRADEKTRRRVLARFSKKTQDGLGLLADMAAAYGAILRDTELTVPKKCMILACADHGAAEMGISAYPVETTVEMTKNYLIARGAGANALARFAHADLVVVDVGIASDVSYIPGLIHKKIAYGTQNFTQGPAMTKEQALQAIETGIEIVRTKIEEGYRCFSLGEMGIGNTTSSAAIVSAFTGISPFDATGRGTGISDERMKIKVQAVADALRVNQPDPTNGLDVLRKVGGFELGCLVGAILGAAAGRAIVVVDGFNATAAALIAASLAPAVKDYMIGSHLSAEKAHKKMLEHLGMTPFIDMGLRLGEGTGASVAQGLLDAAIRIYMEEEPLTPLGAPTVPSHLPTAADAIERSELPNTECSDRCQLLIDNLSKPLGSLCALEHITARLAGIFHDPRPPKQGKQRIYLFQETVPLAVSALCRCTQTELMQVMPADLPTEQAQAIGYGIYLAEEAAKDGVRIIGLIGSGREYGVHHTRSVGTETAVMTGLILGASMHRIAVLLDDRATLSAARLALFLSPTAQAYLFTSHLPTEPEAQRELSLLGLPGYLHLGAESRQGIGTLLGMILLHAGLHMLNDMKTFGEAEVTAAEDGPGTLRQKQEITRDTI